MLEFLQVSAAIAHQERCTEPSNIREHPKQKHTDEARKEAVLHSAKEGQEFLLEPAPGHEFNQVEMFLRLALVHLDIFRQSVPHLQL